MWKARTHEGFVLPTSRILGSREVEKMDDPAPVYLLTNSQPVSEKYLLIKVFCLPCGPIVC